MAQTVRNLDTFDDELALDAEAVVRERVAEQVAERGEGGLGAAELRAIEQQVEDRLQQAATSPLTTRLASTERAAGQLLRLQRAEREIDEAIARARSERNLLYQHDGHPRYSPAEMDRRKSALLVPVREAAARALALAEEATREAEAHLESVVHLDPVELLSGADLERAGRLAPFIKEALDDQTVPGRVILARIEAALREGDRAALACYSRYGRVRHLPVDKLAAAAFPERDQDRARQEDVRRAATGIRFIKAPNAVRWASHASEEEANRAAMLVSGTYISRF